MLKRLAVLALICMTILCPIFLAAQVYLAVLHRLISDGWYGVGFSALLLAPFWLAGYMAMTRGRFSLSFLASSIGLFIIFAYVGVTLTLWLEATLWIEAPRV